MKLILTALLLTAVAQEKATPVTPGDLVKAATSRVGFPPEGDPVLPSLSVEMRGWACNEIAESVAVRSAYEKLDVAKRRNVEWFEGVDELEKHRAVGCLLSCLCHPSEDVQIRALGRLARLKDKRAVPFLLLYAEYMAVHEAGSENATIHGIIHESTAKTLSTLTGVEVKLNGQDPEGLKKGIKKWRKWLVLQTESVEDEKSRDSAEKDLMTAWGRPIDGLQGGIRCRKGEQTVLSPRALDLEIVVRNVGEKSIDLLVYTGPMIALARFEGKTVELTIVPGAMNELMVKKVALQPAEVVGVGRVSIGHVQSGQTAHATVLGIRLAPGCYHVGSENVQKSLFRSVSAKDPSQPKLGTGYLDVELQPASEAEGPSVPQRSVPTNPSGGAVLVPLGNSDVHAKDTLSNQRFLEPFGGQPLPPE